MCVLCWGSRLYALTVTAASLSLVYILVHTQGLGVAQWLRHCATSQFPLVSLRIFSVVPPTEPCALRSTQPLKVSTRDLYWGKGARCFWLTNYHPCSAETSRKSGALTCQEPLGPPRPVAGHLYFTLLVHTYIYIHVNTCIHTYTGCPRRN